jgi:hypothetical protein
MDNPKDAVVVAMPNTLVTPDGSIAVMEFNNSDGSSQILRFPPDLMMLFLSKVFQLFVNQKIQKESTQGYAVVQPIHALTTSAQEDIDGKVVILHLKLPSGLPVAFAIHPKEAEELHRQIGKAIKKSKKQWH